MGALLYDVLGAVARRADFRIEREALLGYHALDVVLGVVDVAHVRHHAADRAPVLEPPFVDGSNVALQWSGVAKRIWQATFSLSTTALPTRLRRCRRRI
jgi:hypothetical protein